MFGEIKTPLKSSYQTRRVISQFITWYLFSFRVFFALSSINRKRSIRFSWWVQFLVSGSQLRSTTTNGRSQHLFATLSCFYKIVQSTSALCFRFWKNKGYGHMIQGPNRAWDGVHIQNIRAELLCVASCVQQLPVLLKHVYFPVKILVKSAFLVSYMYSFLFQDCFCFFFIACLFLFFWSGLCCCVVPGTLAFYLLYPLFCDYCCFVFSVSQQSVTTQLLL